jgi:hypothetical protein
MAGTVREPQTLTGAGAGVGLGGGANAPGTSAGAFSSPATAAAPTAFVAPSIATPQGGGAIRGLGEKFSANPVSGAAGVSIPLVLPPGRHGFGPELALSFNSGAGNGPFGLGWGLGVASIARKTDKGVPRYRDASESDVFVLLGADDLVPLLAGDASSIPGQCGATARAAKGSSPVSNAGRPIPPKSKAFIGG